MIIDSLKQQQQQKKHTLDLKNLTVDVCRSYWRFFPTYHVIMMLVSADTD